MSQPPDALVQALRPAILLDRARFGVPLEVFVASLAPDDPWRPACVRRLADLLRIIDPARARSLLEDDPSDEAAGVLALAALEQADVDAARPLIARIAEPVQSLAQARLDLAEDRDDAAFARLDALVEDPETPPELRAEALSFRSRSVRQRGIEAATADLEALEQLANEHGAFVTGAWVGAWRALLASEDRKAAAQALAQRELAELLGPLAVEVDAAKLGPVPKHVHGAMVVFREQPDRIPEVLVPASALLWRLDAHDDAFRTVHFGARIGHRLFGLAVSQPLLSFATELARHAGPVRWGELHARLRADEAAFLEQR